MPFLSKSQARYLWAKHPDVAKEFAAETKNFKDLPERVKKAMDESFSKIAKALFNPIESPPIPARVTQQKMIKASKQEKMQGMTPTEYRNELTARRTGILAKNRQSNKAA